MIITNTFVQVTNAINGLNVNGGTLTIGSATLTGAAGNNGIGIGGGHSS